MSQVRPTFHPVSEPPDVPDQELATFSKSRGVPSLTPANRTPPPATEPLEDAPGIPPRTPASPKTPTAKKTGPAPKSIPSWSKLSCRVPTYVSLAVNLRAAQERSTARSLILQGLQAIGFHIEEADLIADVRRTEGKSPR